MRPLKLNIPSYYIRNNGVVRVLYSTTSTPQSNDFIGAFSPANTGGDLLESVAKLCWPLNSFAIGINVHLRLQANGPCEVRLMQHRPRLYVQGNWWSELQLHQSPLRHLIPLLHGNKSSWRKVLPRHLRTRPRRNISEQRHVL